MSGEAKWIVSDIGCLLMFMVLMWQVRARRHAVERAVKAEKAIDALIKTHVQLIIDRVNTDRA